ncbi:MAG TPA: saccharopine dehydrogenase C-terminal domain-containing protein [Cyclobacteriaceae bacterium]|jgi:saccharopine dehydrogenase (NADP+, L-glutamate forming)|nr:saccharopine dehydrogenase C-terminal domain-containing protein [Cyclobacteriaceae bacterium]
MKRILLLGAGRSSSACISYLINNALANNWQITVGDFSESAAKERIGSSSNAVAISFNIDNTGASRAVISKTDVVISLIPAGFHPLVAKLCLEEKKHLLTASYVSDEMKAFDSEAKAKGLLFLNECGLDPGIDHMSAMQVINKIKSDGGKLISFESFTGGLIAPETDPDNPWRYKFTWNPRNVVLAGQGVAKFLQDGKYKYIPYQQLFSRTTPINVPGLGKYEGYANRDSLKYVDAYGLQECKTVIRGTLRNKGYCSAWNILAQLGCCDDTYQLDNVKSISHKDFIQSFLDSKNCEEEICKRFNISGDGEEMKRLRWSGFFSEENIGLEKGTPAQIVEHILNKKWKLKQGDKDFIVMWHRFKYLLEGKEKETQAWLTATGEDETQTAMAKTVGLPLAIVCKLLLEGKIKSRGVVIPLLKEIYEPVLHELKSLGIRLEEKESN